MSSAPATVAPSPTTLTPPDVPVGTGRHVAAVSVSGPVERTTRAPQARYGKAVLAAAQQLEKALHQPSLYDEVLGLLARRGHAVPEAVLARDVSRRYEPSAEVEAVWTELYSGDPDNELARLGEALTDVAELVWRWRNDHLVATRRAMGSKTGTGGSAGVAWLEKRAQKNVFPELWTARSHV